MFQLFADRARVELERLRAQAALEEASRDLEFRLERTAQDLRLARDQLAALVEIQRAVAGHLDRQALFTAVAEALQGVIPVGRVILLLPGTDPSALTVYAAYSKTGIQFFEGETIPAPARSPDGSCSTGAQCSWGGRKTFGSASRSATSGSGRRGWSRSPSCPSWPRDAAWARSA